MCQYKTIRLKRKCKKKRVHMETNLHEKSPQKAKKKKLTFQDLNLGASELSGSVYLQHFNVSLSPALLVHW